MRRAERRDRRRRIGTTIAVLAIFGATVTALALRLASAPGDTPQPATSPSIQGARFRAEPAPDCGQPEGVSWTQGCHEAAFVREVLKEAQFRDIEDGGDAWHVSDGAWDFYLWTTADARTSEDDLGPGGGFTESRLVMPLEGEPIVVRDHRATWASGPLRWWFDGNGTQRPILPLLQRIFVPVISRGAVPPADGSKACAAFARQGAHQEPLAGSPIDETCHHSAAYVGGDTVVLREPGVVHPDRAFEVWRRPPHRDAWELFDTFVPDEDGRIEWSWTTTLADAEQDAPYLFQFRDPGHGASLVIEVWVLAGE